MDLITEVNTRAAASMPSHEDSQVEDLEDLSKVDADMRVMDIIARPVRMSGRSKESAEQR